MLSTKEVAGKMFLNGNLFPDDKQEIQALRNKGASTDEIGQYLEDKVQQERRQTEAKKTEWGFDRLLGQCYEAIPKYLSTLLGKDVADKLNVPLSKERIHLVGDHDFRAIA
jgi:DNA-binding transcriptional MerR regulator